MHKSALTIKDYDIDYAKYLAKHKWNIIRPGRELGVGYGTLLKHDLDKLKPSRFRAYSDWFFGPKGVKGTKDQKLFKKFRGEVDIHYNKNLHHAHKLNKPQPLKNQLEAVAD